MNENKKILVVEDNELVCETFVDSLMFNGFDAEGSMSGNDALRLLDTKKWDLILLDINLGDINGFDVLKKIKKFDSTLPVIMITGQISVKIAVEAVNLGAEDYLFKPFKIADLIHRIETVFKQNELKLLRGKERKETEEKIQNAYKELEQRVVDRTSELNQKNLDLEKEVVSRGKTENALLESEARLRRIFNESRDGILVIDPKNYRILDSNLQASVILERENEDLIQNFLSDIKLLSMNEKTLKWEKINIKIESSENNFIINTFKNTQKIIELYFSEIIIRKNEYLMIILRDISERKRAELELSRERKKLITKFKLANLIKKTALDLNSSLTFYDSLNVILQNINDVLGFTYVNIYKIDIRNNSLNLIGIGINVKEKISVNDMKKIVLSKLPIHIFDKISINKPYIFPNNELSNEEKVIFKSINIKTSAILPLRVNNKINGIMVFNNKKNIDINPELIETFKTLSNIIISAWERQIQIDARINAEKKKKEALEVAEKASRFFSLGTMAAGISHEINQPLTALKTKVDSILYWKKRNRNISDTKLKENLQFISDQAERIDEIIHHIRALSQPSDSVDHTPVEINNTIQKSLSLIDRQIYASKVDIILDMCDNESVIFGNITQFEQVMINLSINALQALNTVDKEKKYIKIKTEKDDENCFITVSDNGPGIPMENLSRIFDPFFSSKIDGRSMGVGLSITQSIISNMEGIINVKNNEENGAEFTIKFPLINN